MPKCGMEIIGVNYKGLKVDKCFECGGVWLDAGELEAVSKMDKPSFDKLFSVFKKEQCNQFSGIVFFGMVQTLNFPGRQQHKM
jgi:Zn-finger nucleic acid-binding protein